MNLTRLVYTSRHSDLVMEDFDQILMKSRRNNQRDHITGALIITDTNFMQLLEGSRAAVGQCLMRIAQDRRHSEVQIVSCGDVQHRLFMEWYMHLIMASRVKKEIISMYLIGGVFRPDQMSEFAVEDLCRTLSEGNWDSEAA